MQSWRLYTLLLHVMNCMQTWVECHILVQMCSAEEVEHRKEKKRKYYAFRHQFHEKPSITLGCPGDVEHIRMIMFCMQGFVGLVAELCRA